MRDTGSCIASLITKGSEKRADKESSIITVTGPDALDGKTLIERLNKHVEAKYSYSDTDPAYTERYLRTEFGEQAYVLVDCMIETFEVIKEKKLDKVNDNVKNVIGRDARAVDKLLEQFADFFRP
jgi:hypothetical protein